MSLQVNNKKNPTCLRKTYLFNKGRYSRTRQIVRGAFFFSLLLNINVIFGALLMYYLYTVKVSYIWWFFYLLLLSFVIPSTFRRSSLRIFNVYWISTLFKSLFVFLDLKATKTTNQLKRLKMFCSWYFIKSIV